jgi:hypothetical protein
MKTNLKTFPIQQWNDKASIEIPYQKWRKDFEAELREEQKRIQILDKLSKVSDEMFGKYLKIKEILGE